ncbi:hypothetical protein [Methylobacterium sp. WL116]|uniref:DUF6894 family protein n=1 Tax=Methylobacterium sp. WL116 TaxID=2603889 RepID=UPI0011C86C6A|nr:hypothetical protein [Methylobacterium sp. WL116]TXM81883.1 hypothetical protein FV223_29575 [Methylobacterium sp. WL116]
MPRYFFNTRIGDDWVTDPDGADLPDADAAWEAARDTILAALRAGQAREARDQARLMTAHLVVTDVAGEIVLEFPFAEAVEIDPDPGATLH